MNTLDYYDKNVEKIFRAIDKPRFHVWKIKDYDGKTIQSKYPISNPNDLLKFIHQAKNPKALYVSVSQFLNSQLTHGAFYRQNFLSNTGRDEYENQFPREGYIDSDSLMLETKLFIDLDSELNLNVCQEDTRKIINYMKEKPEFALCLLQFSGRKGIHLAYDFLDKPKIADPIKRMEHYKTIKGRLAKELIKLGLKTIDNNHIEVIKNNFCVFGATHSIKDNGNIITPLTEDEIMNYDIYELLNKKGLIATKSSDGYTSPDDEKVASDEGKISSSHQCMAEGEKNSGCTSSPIYFNFIDSLVNGLDNTYITVIKKHVRRFNISQLKELQKSRIHLSDFYIVGIGDYVYAYNCKLLDFNGLLKVLKHSRSENLRYFIKRRHIPIQITPSIYENGDLAEDVKFIGILKSKYGLNDAHSLPHCKYFGLKYKNMSGKEWNDDEPCHIGNMRVR